MSSTSPAMARSSCASCRDRSGIVGTGTISCEFASFFRALGSEVTLIGRRLLPREDEDLTDSLAQAFEKRGVRIVLGRAQAVGTEGNTWVC